jgi:acyl carrier protein
MEDIAQRIRAFVIDNLLFGQEGDGFTNEDSFLENGLIDSIGILTLVEFVRETFAISIDDTDVVPENWDSVRRIACFVQAKLNSVPS